MNLKQLIKFGLENSSDPVIKNPVLRTALEKPRNMAEGGRIGFKKGKRAEGERRMYSGRMMTEDQIEAKKATRLVPKQEGMTWDKKTKSFRPRKIFTETMSAAERKEKFTVFFQK